MSALVSIAASRSDPPNCIHNTQPGTTSIEGTVDLKAGGASGTLAGNPKQKWQVKFASIQADFKYEPQQPRQGDKITFTDVSKDPLGGQLTQTWYVDGEKKSSTGQQFTWQLPDATPHKVKLVVTSVQGASAQVEKTIETAKVSGQVVAVEQAGPKPLSGVVVHSVLSDGKGATAVTGGDGSFDLALTGSGDGSGAIRFTGLDIPAGGSMH